LCWWIKKGRFGTKSFGRHKAIGCPVRWGSEIKSDGRKGNQNRVMVSFPAEDKKIPKC